MRLRRAIVASSLVGMGSMAMVSMFQTGMIRHLPDPPLRSFPFGQGELVEHGLRLRHAGRSDHARDARCKPRAGGGGAARPRRERPWLPVLAAGFAGAQAAVAAKYLFHQMPKVDRAWCGYCIADALAHFATFALTLPEAAKALDSLGREGRGH